MHPLFVPLLVAALQGASPSDPKDPLQPDAVLSVPGGPLLVHFHSPGTAVASLRLSLPVTESPGEAGGGRALVLAALDRVQPLADRLGVRIEGSRTLHGIVYTATGPAAMLDHLSWLIREAVRRPGEAELSAALARLRVEAERERETPAGILQARLRAGIAPELPPLTGSPASLQALTPATVSGLWARTHQRERMTLVAAAPVPVEVLLSGILDTEVPEAVPTPPPPPPPVRDNPRPQVLRSWYGEAWGVGTPDDPRTAVAARLMAERLATLPGRVEAGVELWELGGRAAVVVTGAAYTQDAAAMRRRIQGLRQEMASGVSAAEVDRVVATLRRETLLAARSPSGLVTVVGYHLDATGDPAGARRFLDDLEAVDLATLNAFLAELGRGNPVTADVRP